MNTLHTNKDIPATSGDTAARPRTTRPQTRGVSLLAALLITTFAGQAIANRPAMDDRPSAVEPPAIDEATEAMPEAPSSVDLMMQQQSRQVTTGDVVQLPAKEMQPGETLKIKLLDYPRRGMSMDKVQHEYGQPIAISETVGKPPITRWTYADRVVYFEYSTVLHVVPR